MTLTPGTRYWLSVVATEGDTWLWHGDFDAAPGGYAEKLIAFNTFFWTPVFDGELVFRLTNDAIRSESVPEPSTLLLLGVVLAGAAGAMRFTRRK